MMKNIFAICVPVDFSMYVFLGGEGCRQTSRRVIT
jgi:hypothetical protein